MLEISCGTVIYTVKNGDVFYLLIKTKHGICGFPKGHMERGETEKETALRETLEETSVRARIIGDFRHQIEYPLSNGNVKRVIYFLADYVDQLPHHREGFEHLDYLTLPYEEALTALTFENTKNILTKADEYIRENIKIN